MKPGYYVRAAIITAVSLTILVAGGCGGCDMGHNWQQEYERAAERAGKAEARAESLRQKKEDLTRELRSVRDKLDACKKKQVELKSELSSTRSRLNDQLGTAQEKLNELRKKLQQKEKRVAAAREKVRKAREKAQTQQKEMLDAAERLVQAGIKMYENAEYDTAEVLLKGGTYLGSENPRAAFQLGYCLARKSNYEAAATSYKKAIDRLRSRENSNDLLLAKALHNRGAALEKLDKPEEAEESYKKALSARDGFAPAHFNLGQLYTKELDSPEDAVRHLRRHIALGGRRSAAARQAIQDLQTAQNTAPTNRDGGGE